MTFNRIDVVALMASTIIGTCSAAMSQEFYAGKKLTIISSAGPGSGHDTFARLLARRLPNHLPGKPTVIVQNMPGAGGARATEYIYSQAPRDGTTIAGVIPGPIIGPLLEEGAAYRYDPLKLVYIGSGDTDTRTCAVLKSSRIKTFADLLITQAVLGSTAQGGSTYDYAYMAANLAGAKIKLVAGYQGGPPPIALAMERGEVDGMCGWGWSIFKSERPNWQDSNPYSFLVQMAIKPEPELVALGVPDFYTFVSGDKRKAAELIISQQAFSRPYIAPPGIPDDRVAILREAYMKALADQELIADFAKMGIVNKPISGADLQTLIQRLYSSPKEIVELARAAQRPSR